MTSAGINAGMSEYTSLPSVMLFDSADNYETVAAALATLYFSRRDEKRLRKLRLSSESGSASDVEVVQEIDEGASIKKSLYEDQTATSLQTLERR